jgi:hypothetical protein
VSPGPWRNARKASFEVSQVPPAIGDGGLGRRQEHLVLRSSQQGPLDSKVQLFDPGAISQVAPKLAERRGGALFKSAHRAVGP